MARQTRPHAGTITAGTVADSSTGPSRLMLPRCPRRTKNAPGSRGRLSVRKWWGAYRKFATRFAAPATTFVPAVTAVCTVLPTTAPTNSAWAVRGRSCLPVGWLTRRLALALARVALLDAVLRARVLAAFFAVVLRLVAAVRRLTVWVVGMAVVSSLLVGCGSHQG